ncbi:pleckstrin homology-like domain family A member 1 [Carcharodon carcharias]|uniref:pleckstrin homology-like domain family A member 1 n=1 Tax=Carcharodon carcharias TaxID=13397 RepID=UPI001B7DD924|nr:pleckstrin homology-like domain family A member 1 [Carcharodon carcharias]
MLEGSGEVMKEGVLEKRSEGLLQLWKKKHCVLTGEGLLLLRPKQYLQQPGRQEPQPGAKSSCSGGKELRFGDMKTVDCVERKGKYMYFTVVMADKRELDFRCPQDAGWNALITLGMVQYKNRRAMEAVHSSRQKKRQVVQDCCEAAAWEKENKASVTSQEPLS